MSTPFAPLGRMLFPELVIPMKLPMTMLSEVPAPSRSTPLVAFPEMMFPAPVGRPTDGIEGRTRIDQDPIDTIGKGAVPSLPMKLPTTTLPEVPAPSRSTPLVAFPEMMFPAPGALTDRRDRRGSHPNRSRPH